MNLDEPILTISVTAKLLKLHPRTLMLYEKSKLITPHRTGTKRRLYSINNLNELQFVKHLTHEEGLNIQGIKSVLKAINICREEYKFDLVKRLYPAYKPRKLI